MYLAAFRRHDETKGLNDKWRKRYQEESLMMRERYPQFSPVSMRYRLFHLCYMASQVLSGRHLLAGCETYRNHGRKLVEIFGDWEL